MLEKKNRLTSAREIQDVLETRGSAGNPLFLLRFKRTGSGAGRAAFVVSKRTAPRAVDRATIKRRMRAAARELLPGGYNLVFIARRDAKGAPSAALKEAMMRSLARLSRTP